MDDTTVMVKFGFDMERVSRNMVVISPVSSTDILYLVNNAPQPHSVYGPGPPIPNFEPNIAALEAKKKYSALEFVNLRIIIYGEAIEQSTQYRVQWYGYGLGVGTL